MTDIEELVREFYSAYNEGDMDSYFKHLADDVKMVTGGNVVYDKHRLRDNLSEGKIAFPDRKFTIERVMTKDNVAMVEYTWTATHKGEYRGFPATGNRIEFPGVDILEFESGKVKVYKYVFNRKLFESGYNPQR